MPEATKLTSWEGWVQLQRLIVSDRLHVWSHVNSEILTNVAVGVVVGVVVAVDIISVTITITATIIIVVIVVSHFPRFLVCRCRQPRLCGERRFLPWDFGQLTIALGVFGLAFGLVGERHIALVGVCCGGDVSMRICVVQGLLIEFAIRR